MILDGVVQNKCGGLYKSARLSNILCRYKQGLIHHYGGLHVSECECLNFPLHMSWIWELHSGGLFAFLFVFTLEYS